MKKLVIFLLGLVAVMAVPTVYAEGTVARSIVTTDVVDREPANDLTHIPASEERILFFTELRGMAGQTIKHRWLLADEQMAEVSFNVGGQRWRIWSSKKMIADWEGDWTVQVVDESGEVVAEKQFSYGGSTADMTESAESQPESDTEAAAPATETAPSAE